MERHAIALVLDEIGTLMELSGENPFKARAFYGAARAVGEMPADVGELARAGELGKYKGFGAATSQVVLELVETGLSRLHEELRTRTPPGLFDLLNLPGLGARRIHTLHVELGIGSLDDLERAIGEGKVAELSGFGARTQAKLAEGLAFVRSMTGRRRLPQALEVAAWLTGFLEGHPGLLRIERAGDLRRSLETVAGIDIVGAVADGAAPVIRAFLDLPGATRGETSGDAAWVRLTDGLELRLRCVPPDEFVAAWLHATGGEGHLLELAARAAERGLRLNEYGLWKGDERLRLDDEVALYEVLGLAYVAPELREGRGEVEAAASGRLPRLVAYEDLHGCFHCHTTWSDGKATVREMAEAARERGWRYLGLADHSKAAAYAGGLTPDEITRQHEEVDAWNAEHGESLWLFKGIEADILPDGRVDYSDLEEDVLARFDYVVGSVHSSFGLSQSEQTKRVLRATENPHLTFLGHPTGRLLLSRDSFAIDLDAVIDAAAERGVAIEINSNPRRLELDWRYWLRARDLGVRTAINPDAHSTGGLDDVRYGVGVARKGWLSSGDVVNAWEIEEVRRFFREGRKA